MANNIVNARIQLKNDTEANWQSATNFKPRRGELIISMTDNTHPFPLLRVGDGTTAVKDLPILNLHTDLTLDHLVLNTNSSSSSINLNQLEYISNEGISYGKIVGNTTGNLALFSKRIIGIFPGDELGASISKAATNEYQGTDGVYFCTNAVRPIQNNSTSLGTNAYHWSNLYATTLHGALALSEITGAGNLQAIEALDSNTGILKKTANNTWTLDTTAYSTLTLGNTAGAALAATGSAGTATTAAKSDHVHPLPTAANIGAAASSHEHGNITNAGCITTAITPAANDYLIIGDNSASGKIGKGPVFVSTTANKFLKDTGAFTAIAAADLPAATTSAKGAVIVGSGLNVSAGTISVAYGTSSNTALVGTTNVNNVTQSAAITTDADYPLLLATSAETIEKIANVNKSSTLLYNPSTTTLLAPHLVITDTSAGAHLSFSRTNYNYVHGPDGSVIAFHTQDGTVDRNHSTLCIDKVAVFPGTTATYNLGKTNFRWKEVYGTSFYGTTYNDYTLADACTKNVDTSLSISSTSANLPTSAAVATLVSNQSVEIIRL